MGLPLIWSRVGIRIYPTVSQPDGTMLFENEDHSYDGFADAKPFAATLWLCFANSPRKSQRKEFGASMGAYW
jgi:hypothetical protein